MDELKLANVIEGVSFRIIERELRRFAREYRANVRRIFGKVA